MMTARLAGKLARKTQVPVLGVGDLQVGDRKEQRALQLAARHPHSAASGRCGPGGYSRRKGKSATGIGDFVRADQTEGGRVAVGGLGADAQLVLGEDRLEDTSVLDAVSAANHEIAGTAGDLAQEA